MSSDSDSPFIQLKNLTRRFHQGDRKQTVLDGLSGEVRRGETLALLGRSGSGKSTLLNLIGGIDRPDAGSIAIDGVEITGLDEQDRTLFRRRHIGFIHQFFHLIPTLTVEENLLLPLELNSWPPEEGHRRVRELLESVALSERAESFPDLLSGGEQQRIAITRALIHRPSLVLADEPTGNLDAENGREVLNLLDRLVRREEHTLLIVTHSKTVASVADRVLTLVDGRLQEADEELLW